MLKLFYFDILWALIPLFFFQDTQKTLSAIIETFIPSSLDESVQQIKALSLNDPPNLNYLANLILHKVSAMR